MSAPARIGSICVYAGSSDAADPALIKAAHDFGATLAREGIRLVYGGGGIGLSLGALAHTLALQGRSSDALGSYREALGILRRGF